MVVTNTAPSSSIEVAAAPLKPYQPSHRMNKDWLENGQGEIFSNQGISLARKQVLESIDSLNDEQVHAVSSFIKYLTEK